MFTTKRQADAIVGAMEEVFLGRDIGRLRTFWNELNRGGGWNGGTAVGNVVQAVVNACSEAMQLDPAKWPPPAAGIPRRLLQDVPEAAGGSEMTKPIDCETARRLDDERVRSHPDTTVSSGFVSASSAVRAEGERALREAHAADPHCQVIEKSGYEAGLASARDRDAMDRERERLVGADGYILGHDDQTYWEAFKVGWHDGQVPT